MELGFIMTGIFSGTRAKVNNGRVDCRLQSLEADAEMKLSINNTF